MTATTADPRANTLSSGGLRESLVWSTLIETATSLSILKGNGEYGNPLVVPSSTQTIPREKRCMKPIDGRTSLLTMQWYHEAALPVLPIPRIIIRGWIGILS